MAVIYEDAKQNPWAGVGQGLQAISGFVQQLQAAQAQKKKMAAAQQVIAEPDPDKQANLAMRLLGPDQGGELIEKLTQAKMAPLALAKAKSDASKAQLDIAFGAERNREQPYLMQIKQKEAAAKQALAEAQKTEALAKAAGVKSEEAKNFAEVDEIRARTQAINTEIQQHTSFAKAATDLAKG